MSRWVSFTLLLLLALQVLLVALFSWQMRRRRIERMTWSKSQIDGWPSAEVILCLRGADEMLPAMLEAVARQKYPGEWRLQIVVDSVNDPSWKIVEEFLEFQYQLDCLKPTWQDLRLQVLKQRPLRGSLKCASLLQAFSTLHVESAVIAIVDADAVVGPEWLFQLVEACCQPEVGAVSGNRWFAPEQFSLMGWTRSVWNAGALVLMTLLAIPWGGSLAVRREVIDAGKWSELLGHGFCEDTGLLAPLRQLGLRYVFRPELLVVDHQHDIRLGELFHWIARQLLTARLHHPAWPLVALHGFGAFALLLVGMINGAWLTVFIYEFGCFCLLVWIEVIAMQSPPRSLWGWALALLPGQLVNGLATITAFLIKKVEWREILYKVTLNPRGVMIMSFPELVPEESSSNSSSFSRNAS